MFCNFSYPDFGVRVDEVRKIIGQPEKNSRSIDNRTNNKITRLI